MAEDAPSDGLLALLRGSSAEGREMDYFASAQLLRAIAGSAAERHALHLGLRGINDSDASRALLRHIESAARGVDREILRLSEIVAQRDVPGMAVGGSLIAASLIGFFSGALTGGLGLFPLAGGMMAFGAAASEAARSNAEKDRLRMMRDNLLSLADETRPG